MFSTGTVIDGRYRIEGKLAQGGQGAIYEATDLRVGGPVALKYLPASDAEEAQRLIGEGQLLASLRHPALPVVRDAFVADGGSFLVMELVRGNELALLVAHRGLLPPAEVLEIAEQLLAVVAYLHGCQPSVFHRDIKPQNLKLQPGGRLMLLDFGLATQTRAPGGYTPRYASPEQVRGARVDARSDLYSSAATIFYLLRGEPPPSALDRLTATLAARTDPLEEMLEALPPPLVAPLRMALALEPEARHPDAAALAQQLRAAGSLLDDPRPSEARPGLHLPPTPGPLIGREAEIAAVLELLHRDDARLVTIIGPGGVGKTRLAIAVAEQFASRRGEPSGVQFVALAAVNDPVHVLPTIAQSLGVRETRDQPLRETVADYLREKRMLLIIDNFEQVAGAATDLAELLARAQHLRLLVTSRAVLNVLGEQVVTVPFLAFPADARGASVNTLLEYSAVALFVARAQAVRPTLALSDENAQAAAAICARLEGLPLAIELAAVRVRILEPAALLGRLDRQMQLLTGGARDLPARQQTLRAAIAWSYDLLDDAERSYFEQLAAFAGTWTLEAAEAVCAEDGLAATDGLPALVDKSLLRIDARHEDEARFAMLVALREFAQERLNERPDADALYGRHLVYYTAFASEVSDHLFGAEQPAWVERVERDYDNMRLGLERACTGGLVSAGVKLALALNAFWDARGYFSEGRSWVQRLLDAGGATADATGASLLAVAGKLALDQGDLATARTYLEQSVALCRNLGDQRELAISLTHLAVTRHEEGAFQEARALLSEAVASLDASDDEARLANALAALARSHHALGELEPAQAVIDKSVTLWRKLSGISGLAIALNIRGMLARDTGDLAQAADLFDESQELAHSIGDRLSIMVALNNLGTTRLYQGDYDAADRHLNAGLELARELGSTRGAATFGSNLSLVAVELGQYERATALALETLEWQRATGDQPNSIVSLNNLGRAAMFQGDLESAARRYHEALDVANALGAELPTAYLEHNLGDVTWCRGERDAAAAWHRKALGRFRTLGDPRGAAYCLEGLAACTEHLRAARLFGAAEALRERVGTPLSPADCTLYTRLIAHVQPILNTPEGAAAWADGRALAPRGAISEALGETEAA